MHLCHADPVTHLVRVRWSFLKQLVDEGIKRRNISHKGYETFPVLVKCLGPGLGLGVRRLAFCRGSGKYNVPVAEEIKGDLPLPSRLDCYEMSRACEL